MPLHLQPSNQAMATAADNETSAGDSYLVLNIQENNEPNLQHPVTSAAASSPELTTPLTLEPQALAANDDNRLRKWIYLMVVTFLTAIGICLQVLETMKNVPELLNSSQFHYFRMFLLMSIAYLTISAFVRSFSISVGLVIEKVAVLFGFLAFILVITTSGIPSEVIAVSSAIFILSLFITFLATYLWRH